MDKSQIRKAIRQKIQPRKIDPKTVLKRLAPFLRQNVLSYFPIGQEMDISAINQFLLEEDRLFFPKIVGEELTICKVTQLEPFHEDLLGTRICEKWEPASILDVQTLLVPSVAVDLSFHRLGRGGGFYDRLMAKMDEQIARLSIIHKEQLVEALPTDPWDQKLDRVFVF
jgi:5-formyltetrahydrofolate cyclo-ligase